MRGVGNQGRPGNRGMTLIEIMIGLTIMALLTGVAMMSVNSLTHASLRSSALELTGAIKLNYDRAIMEKRIQRIGIDLDQQVWWIEFTEDPYTIAAEKLRGKGGAKQEAEEKEEERWPDEDRDEELELALEGGQSARFAPDADLGPPRPLDGAVRFSKVWTGHQEEPFTTGVAYLHFFRGGWTEPAIIELTDGDEFMTLELSPLTGRVTSRPEPLDERKVKDQGDEDPDLEGDE